MQIESSRQPVTFDVVSVKPFAPDTLNTRKGGSNPSRGEQPIRIAGKAFRGRREVWPEG
jgi:hypothetical protein